MASGVLCEMGEGYNSTRYPWSFDFVHARLVTHAFVSSVVMGSLGEWDLSLRAVSVAAAEALLIHF